ncbi:MAG: Phosphoribosyl-AMP cyclohydrolase [Methanonatronarchaeales archaeon]|nr:Phosphoribosyl-AMP cyclohydrolase [Methanonatronarchaeales archaeon]
METPNFDGGFVHAVAVDAESGDVLMLAHMDGEAFERTVETGYAHYWSRSRQQLWKKGKTSGNVQRVREIRLDCDGDAVLLEVEQEGGACHTGHRSCFHRVFDGERFVEKGERVFDPGEVY